MEVQPRACQARARVRVGIARGGSGAESPFQKAVYRLGWTENLPTEVSLRDAVQYHTEKLVWIDESLPEV